MSAQTEKAPVDLYAQLIADIAAPLEAALVERGVDLAQMGAPQLAPPTREGAGDLALPCFPYARVFRKAPKMIADDLAPIVEGHPLVASVESVGGFLNLKFHWPEVARRVLQWAQTDDGALGKSTALAGKKVMVEYCSPNTNKPLHLGHCRNNILGETVSTLMRAAGAEVVRVNLINDRGIHICKSMVAYKRFGEGATPDSMGKKGDHFVGHYYVQFDKAFMAEYAAYKEGLAESETPLEKDPYFNSEHSALGAEARDTLKKWEAGDEEVLAQWRQMNAWCKAGFEETFERMGIGFDRVDLESETYLLGRDTVEKGLADGVFLKRDDGSIAFDLERIGLEGQKVVLRSDGTSLYVTQDIGTALKRFDEVAFDHMTYVVGNEQDRHFQVLFGILSALRPALDGRMSHLSYGMVELPEGKMKSREGKVVDADDLMDELQAAARADTLQRSPDLDDDSLDHRAEALGLAGLKFYLLNFSPKTTFTFHPEKSIQPMGETGPNCQYAYARCDSILRKVQARVDAGELTLAAPEYGTLALEVELDLMRAMLDFPKQIQLAATKQDPNFLTKATFTLSSRLHSFFNYKETLEDGTKLDTNVLRATSPGLQAARVELVKGVQRMIGAGLGLMGITPLNEM
ncbi:MAG: arginine--tRNA ligase [Bradymonadia bacterium]